MGMKITKSQLKQIIEEEMASMFEDEEVRDEFDPGEYELEPEAEELGARDPEADQETMLDIDEMYDELIVDLEDVEEAEIEDDKKAAETEDTVTGNSEGAEETDTTVEPEEKPEEQHEKQKKKNPALFDAFPIIPALISGTSGLLLGMITVAVLYYTASPFETPEPKITKELPPEPPTQVIKVSKPKPKKTLTKPKKITTKPKAIRA